MNSASEGGSVFSIKIWINPINKSLRQFRENHLTILKLLGKSSFYLIKTILLLKISTIIKSTNH